MNTKQQRDGQRAVHLVASAILLAYLYTPLGDNDLLQVMVRAVIVPIVLITGVLMWQMPRLRRVMGARRATA